MGVIIPKYQGRTGNQIFQYVFARLIAEKNGFAMGEHFPCQGLFSEAIQPRVEVGRVCDGDVGPIVFKDGLWPDRTPKYLEMKLTPWVYIVDGFWQDWRYYEPYRTTIRSWFTYPYQLPHTPEPDALVAHVRLGDYQRYKTVIAPQWISKVLYTIKFKPQRSKFYIVTDDPTSRFFDKIKQYRPEIVSVSPEHDWNFIRAAKRIICGNSSFSWWAAYLSDATNVYTFKKWYRLGRHINLAETAGWIPIDGNFWR